MEIEIKKTLITEYDESLMKPVYIIKEKRSKNNDYFNREKEYMCSVCGEKFTSRKGNVIVRGHRTKGYGIRYYCVKCADIVGMWKNSR